MSNSTLLIAGLVSVGALVYFSQQKKDPDDLDKIDPTDPDSTDPLDPAEVAKAARLEEIALTIASLNEQLLPDLPADASASDKLVAAEKNAEILVQIAALAEEQIALLGV